MSDPAALLPLLGAVLAASLAGSLHCAGMCGGIVAAGTGAGGGARSLLAYHGARGAAYACLGGLAGGLGAALDLAAAAAGLGRAAAAVAGAALVLAGVAALLEARGVAIPGLTERARLIKIGPPRAVSRLFAAALALPPAPRAALLGLATGLLPCGWLWAFVAVAAGAGGALAGAAIMGAFWAGTLPILVAGGAGIAALRRSLRPHAPTLTAVALIVAGLVTLGGRAGRLPSLQGAATTHPAAVPAAGEVRCCGATPAPATRSAAPAHACCEAAQ